MKNIKKFNSKDKKRLVISIILFIFIISIVMVVVFSGYNQRIKRVIEKEAKDMLQNVSSQNVITIKHDISARKQLLESISKGIQKKKNFNIDTIVEDLKVYVEPYGFYSMGVIDKNGICYTTNNRTLDLSKQDYYKNGMKGIGGVSKSYQSEDKLMFVNIFTFPIYLDKNVEMILVATYKSSQFSKLLNISSFDGKGESMVINKNGNAVSLPENIESDSKNVLYHLTENRLKLIETIKKYMKISKNQYIEHTYAGEEYMAYYEPIGINDWYLVSYVPKQYIYQNANIINNSIFVGSILMYSGIFISLVLFLLAYNRYQKRTSIIVFTDELTKEKNYEYLKVYFEQMSAEEKKGKSLMVMDIDKFKIVNLMHGSDVGDDLLRYIPRIFKELLPQDSIFKCQGDIFVAILNESDRDKITYKIDKIIKRIEHDAAENMIIPFNLSFGICSLEEFEDLHSIYTNALLAKNEIKGTISKNFNFFNEQNKNVIMEIQQIESRFADALKNEEFEVWYQPKYNMITNEIFGAEALIRWRNPDGSLVSPGKFIPVFENSGQIMQLDEEVIKLVCENMKQMKTLGLEIKPISINLSRVHLESFEIIEKIQQMITKYEIRPDMISFEITESVLMEENELLNIMVHQLHEIGVGVDIDDYGTGVSTLNSLAYSDFNTLKLDKSFIDYIGNYKMDIIIRSTISMARELNMQIIAEGVEKQEQVAFLVENHCDIAQGYYFSKPLDKESYFSLLLEEQTKSS